MYFAKGSIIESTLARLRQLLESGFNGLNSLLCFLPQAGVFETVW